ncbi:MAG: hypothetical protein ABIW38_08665 [Ferruginibacter sp.]
MQPSRKLTLRRSIRWLLFIAGIFLLLVLGLHAWFVNNARSQLIKIVHDKSQGKVSLRLSHLSYNFLNDNLEVKDARIFSTNKNEALAYNVSFSRLNLKVQSFWPLLLKKKLILDSIRLENPVIHLIKNRNDLAKTDTTLNNVSLPREIGKIYNSMLDVLDDFHVRRIIIKNASFKLTNAVVPQVPVSITNIYLNVNRDINESIGVAKKQAFQLQTTNQFINLPGGRHMLAFKKFNLQLLNKRIDLDSCTITAIPTDSTSSSYKIFFTKLSLVGVDFAAMYEKDIIKADSVYCENPLFQVRLNTAMASTKVQKPDFEKIIRELTGNLNLGFVGVKDAGIQVEIIGKKSRSLINSHKDNFQVKGLVIDADRERPASIDEFNMLARDYLLYNNDSSSVYRFDSLHFRNDKIILNNFTINSNDAIASGSKKSFSIPQFELSGLDWYSLIFNEDIVADEAILYGPVIRYKKGLQSNKKSKRNLFSILASLDSLLTLKRIKIINGDVDVRLGKLDFQLHKVNLALNSDEFLSSSTNRSLLSSMRQINFSSANLVTAKIKVELKDAVYSETRGLYCGNLSFTLAGSIDTRLENVLLGDLIFNDEGELIVINRLNWEKGKIIVLAPAYTKKSENGLLVKNISGNNTEVNFAYGQDNLKTQLKKISFNTFNKTNAGRLSFENLFIDGGTLNFEQKKIKVAATSYQVNQDGETFFTNLSLNNFSDGDSLNMIVPNLQFHADINMLLNDSIVINNLIAKSPIINMVRKSKQTNTGEQNIQLAINNVSLINPSIDINIHKSDSVLQLYIPANKDGFVHTGKLQMNEQGISVKDMELKSPGIIYRPFSGLGISAKKGEINIRITSLQVNKDKSLPLTINVEKASILNPDSMQFSKNIQLWVKDASAENFQITLAPQNNIMSLLRENSNLIFNSSAAELITSGSIFTWKNAHFYSADKMLEFDSFNYVPVLTLEQTLAAQTYQQDYIHFDVNHVSLKGFDADKFRTDILLTASELQLDKPSLYVYRDKQKLFKEGKIKLLPAALFQSMAFPFNLPRLSINNGKVFYTEKNEKAGTESMIKISNMHGQIANIKSRPMDKLDSLRISLKGFIFDSSLLSLKVNQSYADTLGGMRMNLGMKYMNAQILNPIIGSFANVKLKSGIIDSFAMAATANDYHALGEMTMYYHNLKMQLLKKGDSSQSGLIQNIASFLINTFIIKKNSNGRIGVVYFERLQDRSFFNYLVKISLSGLLTTTGAKRNKTLRKKYEQAVTDKKLPAILP